MSTTNSPSAQLLLGHSGLRTALLMLVAGVLAVCGGAGILSPYMLGQTLRYPNATFTGNCGPLITSAPVVTGPGRISYRFTQCYLSTDEAEQVAGWYEKQGWTQRVYTPMAQATQAEIHRFGPLMVVNWNQVTALHLSHSPTLIKVEVGVRFILNK